MTVAAAQYHDFARQVSAGGGVHTFVSNGEYLVFNIDGREVVPFWSSSSRLDRVVAMHPKYAAYERQVMPLSEFLDWLPELEAQGIHIGVNWSGAKLTGYDVEASRLAALIDHAQTRSAN